MIKIYYKNRFLKKFYVFEDGLWGSKRWYGLKGVIIGKKNEGFNSVDIDLPDDNEVSKNHLRIVLD